jgi:Transposase DDE domain
MIPTNKLFNKCGFDAAYFDELAKKTGLVKRTRKLTGIDYFYMLLFNSSQKIMSYNTWAATFLNDIKKSVSRQRLHKHFTTKGFQDFFNTLFNDIFNVKLKVLPIICNLGFKRILIQDSTIIKLPDFLYHEFSGVSNGTTKVANARIQVATDILSSVFVYQSIDTYTKNDMKASFDLAVEQGDLIIRDRGYFNVKHLNQIMDCKADFITRHHNHITYYTEQGVKINLFKHLSSSTNGKFKVRIGKADAKLVWMYTFKVSEELANTRRMQAKKNNGGKRVVTKETLAMLSWAIYITTIDNEQLTFDDLFQIYGLRWRIEIIFKALKSELNLSSIHKVPKSQLCIIIKTRLLAIIIAINLIYQPLSTMYRISLLKLMRFISKNLRDIEKMIIIDEQNFKMNDILKNIIKYCSYDKRKKRKNFEEQMIIALS